MPIRIWDGEHRTVIVREALAQRPLIFNQPVQATAPRGPRSWQPGGSRKSSAVDSHRRFVLAETVEPNDEEKPGKLFIFGFGYVALGLANILRARNWQVKGTCRGRRQQKELESQGFDSFLFDTDRVNLGLGKEGITALREATHVLVGISPSSHLDRCPVTWILGREFKAISGQLRWIGFLSTTSVYGDHDGAWVSEESEALAASGNGLSRRVAELSWLSFMKATGLPVHIFRLAGIYGPGRSAIDVARQGEIGGKRAGKRYTSRCHVFDICQVLLASMLSPRPGEIYNVVDDDPSSREAVLDFVRTTLLPTPPQPPQDESLQATPPEATVELAPEAKVALAAGEEKPRARKVAEKRVSNTKVKVDLGVQLAFPSYQDGLKAIHQGNLVPFE